MEQSLSDRVSITINTFIPEFVDQFLEDKQKQIDKAIAEGNTPQELVDLIITLKYWANPQGNYTMSLHESEQINFKDLIAIVNEPTNILPQAHFKPEDRPIIADLVQLKLNAIADGLIKKYNLQTIINERTEANAKKVQEWWESKSLQEQENIKRQYDNLTPEQKVKLQQKMPANANVTHVHYYVMSNCHSDLNYVYYRPVFPDFFDLLLINYMFHHSHGYPATDVGCGGCSGGSNDDGQFWLAVAAVIGFIAMITAGVVGGLYGLKKAWNSLVNTLCGDKVARSLFRLAGIGGGGYGGFVAGTLAGASMGSAIPGFGTAAGAIVGGVFGAGIGIGLAALLTKYIAKGLSYLTFTNHFNPTNPEKYELSSRQQRNLLSKGFDLAIVETMMHAIKREKDKLDNSASFPFTAERKKKNKLNRILYDLKKGKIEGPVKIGRLYYDANLSRFEPEKKPAVNTKDIISTIATDNNYQNFQPSEPSLTVNVQQNPTQRIEMQPMIPPGYQQSTGTENYTPYRP